MDPIVMLIILIYGVFVSFLEERFGAFERLLPSQKQFVNGVVGFFVPAVASLLTYLKTLGYTYQGTPQELAQAMIFLLAPAAVWVVTQIAHQIDKWLKKVATADPEYTTLPILPEK